MELEEGEDMLFMGAIATHCNDMDAAMKASPYMPQNAEAFSYVMLGIAIAGEYPTFAAKAKAAAVGCGIFDNEAQWNAAADEFCAAISTLLQKVNGG